MNINITSKSNNYNIGEHKLNKIINVISYKYEHCKPILNIIQSENINDEIKRLQKKM